MTTQIGELVDGVKTWNPSRCPDDEFEYIDLSAVDNRSKTIVASTTTRGIDAPSRARQLVATGDVLVSTVRPNLNAVAVVPPELDGATASTGFTVLRPSDDLDGRFLFHWVQAPTFIADMVRKAKGASYPAVSDRIVKESQMPAPPLSEQRRIAAILDQADAIRAKRRGVLTRLDSLTQSIFHDMFDGDRGTVRALAEVADFYGGASLPRGREFQSQSAGTLLMKVSDMNAPGNETHIGTAMLWTEGSTPRSSTVGPGAIVLPKRGAAIATNKKRITTRPTALDPNLMGVQPKPEALTSSYLYAWFKSFDLATITSGSTVPQLNKQDLAPLQIPVPTLTRQEEFASRLATVADLRQRCERASEAGHRLLDALQSRAFRGEL